MIFTMHRLPYFLRNYVFEGGYFMKLLSLFELKGKSKILIILLAFFLLILITKPMFSLKNYNALLDADTLSIYSNNKLVTTVNNPAYMMDTFKDIVGVGLTNTSQLGTSRISMTELYRLEFVKDGKIISTIKILTPKTQKAIDRVNQSGSNSYWREFDDHYVIMTENFQYFLFGADFFKNLSEILKGVK